MTKFAVLPETAYASAGQLSVEQLEGMQHFAELGRLSASLLHEISNPLTAAILQLDQHQAESLAGVQQAKQSLKLLRRYVEAARQQIRQQSSATSFGLKIPVEQVKRLVMPLARKANVQLAIEAVPVCRLRGDAVKFQQVLTNLIVNAIEAYRNETNVSLSRPVQVRFQVRRKHLLVQVIDWGEGIAPNQLPHLFEPFYTTKDQQAGYGLGIGLTIVRQHVVDDFCGSISVTSSRRYGTQFRLKLPLL